MANGMLQELINSGQVPPEILQQMEAARDPRAGGFVQRGSESPMMLQGAPQPQPQVNPVTAPRMGESPYPGTPTMPTVADLVPEEMQQSFLRSMESKFPGVSRYPAARVPLQVLGKEWEDRYYKGLDERQQSWKDQQTAQASGIAEKRLAETERSARAREKAADARQARLDRIQTAKDAEAAKAEESRLEGSIKAADNAIETARKAYMDVGQLSAGFIGGVTKWIPGTPALNLDQALEPIRAITSFEQLNRMKEASRTGGALGQIAVRELELLSASVASLDTSQGPAQLRENLRKVVQHFSAWKEKVKKAWEVEGAPSGGWEAEKERRYQEWKARQGK